jgi:hypothetical protein
MPHPLLYVGVVLVALMPPRAGASPQAPAAVAQASKIALRPRFEVGQRQELQLVRVREEWQGAARVRSNESTTAITIDGAPGDDMVRRIAALVEGVSFEYRVSAEGVFAGVADEARVIAQLDERFGAMAQALRESAGADEAARKRVDAALEQMRPLLSGPALLASSLREPQFYYVLGAGEFERGKPFEVDDQLPSPLGGAPLPARRRVELVDQRSDGAQALLVWSQRMDAKALQAALLARAIEQAEKAGERAPTAEELVAMDVRDDALIYVDLASGLPARVEFARTTITGERRRIDGFRIEPRAAAK